MALELCVTSQLHIQNPDGSSIPFEHSAALAKEAGFTQMDYGFSARALLRSDWEENALRCFHAAQAAGIVFRYAHLPYDYPHVPQEWGDFYTASCRAIDLAVRFGVECAAIHPCTSMTKHYNHDLQRRNALDFLRPYCDYAKGKGLTLALENMRGPGQSADPAIKRYATDVDDLLDLAQTLDIGVCWDTGHGHISAQTQYDSIRKIAPRLKMLHINDNFAEDDVHLAPFLGTVDWHGVTSALREIGFSGALNLEVGCKKRPLSTRAAYAAYMAASAKQLHAMITD